MQSNINYQERFKAQNLPVWKRVKLPEDLFPIPKAHMEATIDRSSESIDIEDFDVSRLSLVNGKEGYQSIGQVFCDYVNGYYNSGYILRAKARVPESPVVRLSYDLSGEGAVLVDNHYIEAEAGTKLDVVMDYHVQEGNAAKHYGITRVHAKRGSLVRLYKLQRMDAAAEHFDQIFGTSEEGARIEIFDVQIGGKIKVTSVHTILEGRHSEAASRNLYLGEADHQLDLSFTMTHRGEKSRSEILSKGALTDHARKVFRGNLFFDTGSKQAVGREEEFVMLMNQAVQSDSIPALMCSEDDVIGEHAASIGQVDQNKLFYLMSRGFSEIEAKKLVIKASFEELLGEVPFEDFRATVNREIDLRLSLSEGESGATNYEN